MTDPSPSTEDPTATLVRQFEEVGAAVMIGPFSARNAHCLVQYTPNGWTLYRSHKDERGSFFAEGCSEEEALRMIRDGAVPRETEVLNSREQARRILSTAIRDNFGTEGPQAEQLFEALDKLAS